MIRLDPGEQSLVLARRHPAPVLDAPVALALVALVVSLLLAVNELPLLALLVSIIGVVPLSIAWLAWRRDIVVVTDRRLVHRWGIISLRSSETAIERIGDVRIEQGLVGRLLGYGDIEVVAGSDLGADRLRQLRDPERVAAAIRAARRD